MLEARARTASTVVRVLGRRFLPAAVVIGLVLACFPLTASADGAGGWIMVGAPNHSSFGPVEEMVRWDPVGARYVDVTTQKGDIGSDDAACTGYWAYFPAPAAINLPLNGKPGDTRACALSAGWNLVGNPFSDPARLPASVTAYYFTHGGYQVEGFIPVGASVWVYETAASTVTITMT